MELLLILVAAAFVVALGERMLVNRIASFGRLDQLRRDSLVMDVVPGSMIEYLKSGTVEESFKPGQ